MPYHDPDPTDPSMLVGVGVTCSDEDLRSMAASFASELAQLGNDARRIVSLFEKPFYAGPHLAWRTLGEEQVRHIVKESVEFWSHCRVVVTAAGPDRAVGRGRLLQIHSSPRRT